MSEGPKSPQFNIRALFVVTASAGIYMAIWRFVNPNGGHILALAATGVLVILVMIVNSSPRQ